MTLLASNYIAALRVTLLDPSPGVTWTDSDLLLFIAAAEREVCTLKQEAYVVRGAVAMVAGNKQTLPAGATASMDFYQNTASKKPITQIQRGLLDEASRWWPVQTPQKDVNQVITDSRNPTQFDVDPPNDGDGLIECLYCFTPPNFATTAEAMHLPDIYEAPIKFFALSEAYSVNSKRQDLTKVSFYRNEARTTLGIKSQSQVAVSPKVGAPGGQ